MNLFDMHCDTLYECYETNQQLRENTLCIDADKIRAYCHYAQFFALFCGTKSPVAAASRRSLLNLPPEQRLDALLATAHAELSANADWLTLCETSEELHEACAKGKAAAFLSIEDAELLVTDAHLARAYDAGVRLVTLTWNRRNQYACGAQEDNSAGLTARGCTLVHTMVEMGMIIDVSHLSERGFWEVCVETEAPLAATHSNSRTVCDHLRNLTDLQALELIRRGGCIGVTLYSPFVTTHETCTQEDVLRHIEQFCALGGERQLVLGADFDGCDRLPDGIGGVRDMACLAETLLRHNYLQSTVEDIFYGNLSAFINRML